jgi:hypothetical protein
MEMTNWLHLGDDVNGLIADPAVPWLFETPSYVLWVVLACYFLLQARRNRQLSIAALTFLSATTMFWQEFYADWGAKLVYSPAFALIPIELPFTTPNKPWLMFASYGWYFVAIFTLQVWLVNRLRHRNISLTFAVLMVSIPFFYLWDLLLEGTAVYMGWWTYVDIAQPMIMTARGALPLLHPIGTFTVYGTIMTLLLSQRDDTGRVRFEALGGAAAMMPGPGREIRRLLTWIVVMNLVYALFLTLPCMLVRIFIGE